MSKERMVQVTKDEYENLIRDQHTVDGICSESGMDDRLYAMSAFGNSGAEA